MLQADLRFFWSESEFLSGGSSKLSNPEETYIDGLAGASKSIEGKVRSCS